MLFPIYDDGPLTGYSIVLRIRPAFAAESQIVVRRDGDKLDVIEYRASENIYYKLIDLCEKTGEDDVSRLARQIAVQERRIVVPGPAADRWRQGYLRAAGLAVRAESLKTARALNEIFQVDDGVTYEIWYRSKIENYHRIMNHGPRLGSHLSDRPLYDWAVKLEAAASKIK